MQRLCEAAFGLWVFDPQAMALVLAWRFGWPVRFFSTLRRLSVATRRPYDEHSTPTLVARFHFSPFG
jgi:hypothetical protein